MKRDYGDMYQYILESKKAVRNIISNHEEIFHDAIEYFFNGNYEPASTQTACEKGCKK